MDPNGISIVNRVQILIQPVKKVSLNPRETRQEQYAPKKKPDKQFSEILSGEIASVATKSVLKSPGKMNYGLSSLGVKKLY